MMLQNAIVAGHSNYVQPEEASRELQPVVINRAYLVAHLLTASTEQAEYAMIEAIASWGPNDGEEALLQQVLHASIRGTVDDAQSSDAGSVGALLPAELRAVLRLSSQLRQCYVLRVLIGLPRDVCAWLLHISLQRVDQNTCAALACLPLPVERSSGATEYFA